MELFTETPRETVVAEVEFSVTVVKVERMIKGTEGLVGKVTLEDEAALLTVLNSDNLSTCVIVGVTDVVVTPKDASSVTTEELEILPPVRLDSLTLEVLNFALVVPLAMRLAVCDPCSVAKSKKDVLFTEGLMDVVTLIITEYKAGELEELDVIEKDGNTLKCNDEIVSRLTL